MFDNLPELMESYPIGCVMRDVVPKMKFTVDGYLYDGKNWHPMIKWLDEWFTIEQMKEKFSDKM